MHCTTHAWQRMLQRDIDWEELKEMLERGCSRYTQPDGRTVTVSRLRGRPVKVVCADDQGEKTVVTVVRLDDVDPDERE